LYIFFFAVLLVLGVDWWAEVEYSFCLPDSAASRTQADQYPRSSPAMSQSRALLTRSQMERSGLLEVLCHSGITLICLP